MPVCPEDKINHLPAFHKQDNHLPKGLLMLTHLQQPPVYQWWLPHQSHKGERYVEEDVSLMMNNHHAVTKTTPGSLQSVKVMWPDAMCRTIMDTEHAIFYKRSETQEIVLRVGDTKGAMAEKERYQSQQRGRKIIQQRSCRHPHCCTLKQRIASCSHWSNHWSTESHSWGYSRL